MNRNRTRKLTTGMIRIILLCWVIPYLVISSALIQTYSRRNRRQISDTVCSAMDNAGRIITEKIVSVIEDSRQASYDGVIKKSYEQFLKDENEQEMHRSVSDYLNRTYKYSRIISNTILLYERPMTMEYYTYSNVAGATYTSIDEFRSIAEQTVRECAKELGTNTLLTDISGHLYVVRNIVLSNYEPFAVLVMEVNKERLFEGMDSVVWKKTAAAVLDGQVIWQDAEEAEDGALSTVFAQIGELQQDGRMAEPKEGKTSAYYDSRTLTGLMALKVNGQRYYFEARLDQSQLLGENMAFLWLYVIVVITLIPLLAATFSYFYRNINRPIGQLMKASEKIRSGEYGYEVEPFDKNAEIGQLVDTFNHMSVSLEDSFNRIYLEEIAERDATLKALQSQINPHFLNNTLEIINWKARMNGNEDVSEMISALSVMMNATLNRNNEMYITLEEELTYVDAYLYIIRERFGEKFRFTKEVDDTLLQVKVPRLIIQPIVENAVEHGGDRSGCIEGCLKIFTREGTVMIRIENNGTLSESDREKILLLLSDDHLGDTERLDRMSIGIRNVNLRLHLMCEEGSGLEITETEDRKKTVSLLRIKMPG